MAPVKKATAKTVHKIIIGLSARGHEVLSVVAAEVPEFILKVPDVIIVVRLVVR